MNPSFEETYLTIVARNEKEKNAEWDDCKAKLVYSLNVPSINIDPPTQAAIVEICKACFMVGYGRGSYNTSKGLLNDLGLGFLLDLVENSPYSPSAQPKTTTGPSRN